ncbi:hypothetical protein [Glycomyces harbinensis]|uniref:Uncharacterized protein n=1 Tax=Glycomyces harbinensis TaxID=58114 RepID=A0A1G6TSI2_9ACTN|nr:hypothetical protein [Glycomyces harbinensis]SDD32030.1 hypothetical protein SAMN05216270_103128 [Glycomyces harbinensis]
MNWRLFGWLAAMFGGAIVAIWIVASVIGWVIAGLGVLIKIALVVAVIGGLVFLGFKGYQAIGGSDRRQIRK